MPARVKMRSLAYGRSVWKQRHDLWGDDYPPAGSLLNSPLKFPKPAGMRWDTFEKKALSACSRLNQLTGG
ncbi:Uncharacterised protein [Klebsiella pneumoniae]|nr:Uncharacterised protein [Klebsiella pneumoniae]